MMSSKLDRNSGKLWKDNKLENEIPMLGEFKLFLKDRADVLETLEYYQSSKAARNFAAVLKTKTFYKVFYNDP